MSVSIIICTANRAESLRETLDSLDCVDVPVQLQCELLVVDNASTDDTRKVVEMRSLRSMPIRYLYEPKRGQANARNTGLAASTGEVIVFTDDDVRPRSDWLARMCAPILAREAEAVAGGVRIASHLERPWLETPHFGWLADTRWLLKARSVEMVGANMAFSRRVLDRVPQFDPELGPGALGLGDDSLFSWQLKEAGFRIHLGLDIEVAHHCDRSRLTRSGLLESAKRAGWSRAYTLHHWEHQTIPRVRLRIIEHAVRAQIRRVRDWWPSTRSGGVSKWELGLIKSLHCCRQFVFERDRPRNYKFRGMVKLSGPGASGGATLVSTGASANSQ
jgi:glucosyl-dolichyl phosphate glucuronosyltransferase